MENESQSDDRTFLDLSIATQALSELFRELHNFRDEEKAKPIIALGKETHKQIAKMMGEFCTLILKQKIIK